MINENKVKQSLFELVEKLDKERCVCGSKFKIFIPVKIRMEVKDAYDVIMDVKSDTSKEIVLECPKCKAERHITIE